MGETGVDREHAIGHVQRASEIAERRRVTTRIAVCDVVVFVGIDRCSLDQRLWIGGQRILEGLRTIRPRV